MNYYLLQPHKHPQEMATYVNVLDVVRTMEGFSKHLYPIVTLIQNSQKAIPVHNQSKHTF